MKDRNGDCPHRLNFDSIVAGAGIWGCTVARRLAEARRKVLVLEKRTAVGGNCRCEIDPETGIVLPWGQTPWKPDLRAREDGTCFSKNDY